jgi:hypothetical protein
MNSEGNATFDVYEATYDLGRDLASNGHTEWAARLSDAIEAGSTGTEIFMAIRWVIQQLRDEVAELSLQQRAKAEEIVAYINDSLRI